MVQAEVTKSQSRPARSTTASTSSCRARRAACVTDRRNVVRLYLIAYCHRRRDVRLFAVERIRSLTVTSHAFQLPLGFDVEANVENALVVMRGRLVEVELAFDRATAAWVRDRIWHPSQRLASTRGGLRMTLRVADTRELTGWILSFGRGVRVIRPPALRERVRQEALALARH